MSRVILAFCLLQVTATVSCGQPLLRGNSAKKLTERTLTGRETNRSVGRRVWASIEVLSVATRGARYRLFAARGLTPRMLGTGQAAALLSSSLKDVS